MDDIVCITADIFSVNGVVISKVCIGRSVMTDLDGLRNISQWIMKCVDDGQHGFFLSPIRSQH